MGQEKLLNEYFTYAAGATACAGPVLLRLHFYDKLPQRFGQF